MRIYDLGIDYLDRRNALIEAVTLDDVNRVAKALLDPTTLTMVVVGEPEGISE
jgi:zinc protease